MFGLICTRYIREPISCLYRLESTLCALEAESRKFVKLVVIGMLLSTQMALLCLSADNSSCWYTKGHFRIEVCLNTIDGHDMRCIYHSTSLPYYFSKCWMAYATIFIATCIGTRLFPLTTSVLYMTIYITTRVHQHTRVSFKKLTCHMRVAYINSRVHLVSTLKNIKQD